jgi:hypothetical protein
MFSFGVYVIAEVGSSSFFSSTISGKGLATGAII